GGIEVLVERPLARAVPRQGFNGCASDPARGAGDYGDRAVQVKGIHGALRELGWRGWLAWPAAAQLGTEDLRPLLSRRGVQEFQAPFDEAPAAVLEAVLVVVAEGDDHQRPVE